MAISQDKIRVQVTLDNVTHQGLVQEAKQKGLSLSAYIRMIILDRKK